MRVLIADDHEIVRDALKLVVANLASNVTIMECSNYSEAVALAEQDGSPDLAVLDLRMPGMTGPASVGEFHRQFPQIPAVVLSGQYRRQDIVEAFRNGAAGFIPKTLNSAAMVNALRLVLAGGKYIPTDLLPDGVGGPVDSETPDEFQTRGYPNGDLTAREEEVLATLWSYS
jgi:DNA-binding NarL/FixJ family response regulator